MKKIITIIVLLILITSITLGALDYNNVANKNEKPKFCFINTLYLDGGSGTYRGLGYGFYIEGDFMGTLEPYSAPKGITKYKFYILGIEVTSKEIN